MEFKHKSVLLEETIEGLDIKPDGIYVDGTLGGAGHAGEVCRKLSAKGRFIGIDQDQDAIIAGQIIHLKHFVLRKKMSHLLFHEIGRASCRERV